jgi:virulence factor Mce-like protein
MRGGFVMRGFIRPLSYVVAALLVIGGGALAYSATNNGEDTYGVTAYFEKGIGLFPNSDVDILGVPVGKVRSVEPAGDKVKVEMEISDRYKVPADAFAQIVPISVISDRYIQLAPAYQGGPTLDDGAVLDVDRTQIPAELDDVFKQLKKLLDAIEPGKKGEPGALGDLVVQLNQTLKDREQDLKGTLISASELTDTLSDAKHDISGMLVNLDGLFEQLATRANSFGSLNRNFALVMTALAESRDDLTGTLENLGHLTMSVGDLVSDHGDRLGRDLKLASRITSAVLKNRASVIESLEWLSVVGKGLKGAYHPPPFDDIDIRDNAGAHLQCQLLGPLPDGPIKDELERFCSEETGEPRRSSGGGETSGPAVAPDYPSIPGLLQLDCDQGVRKVRRQVRKVEEITLPAAAEEELIDSFKAQLRKLKRKCEELGRAIQKGDGGGGLLDDLEDTVDGTTDRVDDPLDSTGLRGSAGSTPAPSSAGPGLMDRVGDWVGGFVGFLGWS